ncbi:MAG: TniQ family protein, partial [Burkholderiaceae bacterium]
MDNIFPITPEPYPTESALGWLLRTSEENYLPSAWHVFKLSGLSQAYMTSPAFDPSLLAGWFNKKPEKLRYLSYRYLDDKRRLFQFREQCINSRMLDLRAPKICPCCISENGYIDALWDLELVIVCPTHGRSLIDRCPTCKKRLSWLRPGLLICRCGASLKNLVGIAQHNSVVMLHQHIKQIAHKEYRLCAMSGSNFEQSPFYGESLEFSLRLIRVIGAFCVFRVLRQNSLCPAERDRVVEEAANILSDWPNNFYRFLNDLANRPVRRNQYRVGIRGLIAEFMNALYGLTRDYSEGKNTLLQIRKFLTSHCEGRITGEFSKDILEDGTLPQWVCINTGAKILGVVSPTLLNILKTNKIRHRVERLSKSSIIHVFTADLKPELFGPT